VLIIVSKKSPKGNIFEQNCIWGTFINIRYLLDTFVHIRELSTPP
jgi:hypothetical protein